MVTIMEDNTSLIERLNHVNNWINNCDQKSGILLAFIGVVVTLIFTTEYFISRIISLAMPIKDYWLYEEGCFNFTNFIMCTILITLSIFIIKSIYYLFLTINGCIDEKQFFQDGLEHDSLFFFGAIARKTFISFRDQINDSTYNSTNDLLSQIYINSVIAQRKFLYYKKAIKNIASFLITFGILFVAFLFI